MSTTIDLVVRIGGEDLENGDLTEMASGLRRELLTLDVGDVRSVTSGDLPRGAKSGTAVTLGALVVSAGPAVVAGVVAIVSSWLSRQPRHIEVEIDGQKLNGTVTAEQRAAIVAAYLAKTREADREPRRGDSAL